MIVNCLRIQKGTLQFVVVAASLSNFRRMKKEDFILKEAKKSLAMMISNETREQLNKLIAKSFDCNAQADNMCYCIGYAEYNVIEDIVHHSFAHAFPALADELSDLMLRLNARPVRSDISGYDHDYEGNLEAIFADMLMMCHEYRQMIIETIDIAEMNSDYEIKIGLEEFLVKFLPYMKQVNIWLDYAKRYNGNYKSFNVHFPEISNLVK